MEKIAIKQSSSLSGAPEKYMEWKAPEYEYREKTADWFWILGIITLSLVFAAIMLENILLGLLIGLAGFSMALYGAKKPGIVNFKIGPRGMQIKDKIYGYENIKSFWINYNPPRKKELIIESKKALMPHMSVMLGDTNPEEIRNYLLRFLKEEKIEESFTATIAEILRF